MNERLEVPKGTTYDKIKQKAIDREFLNEDGELDRSNLINWRESQQLTRRLLAEAANLPLETLRDIENPPRKSAKVHPNNFRNLLIALFNEGAFNQPEGPAQELKPQKEPITPPYYLIGKWHSYHLTSDENNETVLARTDLEIFPNGECEQTHLRKDDDWLYNGKIIDDSLNIATFEITHVLSERFDKAIWKVNFITGGKLSLHEGAWIGTDCRDRLKSGKFILSEKILPDSEAIAILSDSNSIVPIIKESNQVQEKFSWESVWNSIQKLETGSEVRILTAMIPDWNTVISEIEEIALQKELKWRILLINPEHQETLDSRFKLRREFSSGGTPEQKRRINSRYIANITDPKSSSRRIQEFRRNIISQVGALEELKESLNIDLDIRYSSAWFTGQGIQAGDRVLYLNFMFATKTAVNSPGVVARDKNSKLWKFFNEDFQTIWDYCSEPAWK